MADSTQPTATLQQQYEKVCARIGELFLELKTRESELAKLIEARSELIKAHQQYEQTKAAANDGSTKAQA